MSQSTINQALATITDASARELLDAVSRGVVCDLCDSDTADVVRNATTDEAIASALAGPEGHILVDGRRCYVSL